VRQVESGAMLGDDIMIHSGLAAGELVAASGAFKLRDGVLVVAAGGQGQPPESDHLLSQQ
jgi:membrane fusion protein (multidrug efflux system)